MRTRIRAALLLNIPVLCAFGADGLTANDIMARVAENQERAVEARARWTHHQDVLVRVTHSNGKLAREDHREYTVLPGPAGIEKKLLHASQTPAVMKGMRGEMDSDIAEDLADDLTNQKGSRDGLSSKLFPFTRAEQAKYEFRLLGRETFRDREVWRVGFKPGGPNPEQAAWKGEALIDAAEFQPVMVTTRFAHRIPLAVRTLLGTNIGYLGFKVSYRKLGEGVWLPETYGGEFSLRALFFYNRRVGVSMRNSDFRVADVHSRIEYSLNSGSK